MFEFDLTKLGECSPQLLGSIFYTIIIHPKVVGFKGNKAIILTPHYLDGDIWLTGHYNFTYTSTPEDFTKHFLHLTNKYTHRKSIMVFLIAKVVLLT